uniref:CCHC-type domain-containing protein n=1 Tax=Oryza meridionalis TaxID=40149 RepID=A0A0E0F6V9_9ORYZ
MAQRWRSRARRDPDVDEEEGSPPERRRRAARSGSDDEEAGNEDLSLEIVARAARRRRRQREASAGFAADAFSSGDEIDEDAVVELGEADPSSRKRRKEKEKKKRRKEKRKQRKGAPPEGSASTAAADKEESQVAGTQEAQTGTAESVLTEDGPDAPLSDNIVLRKLLRIPRYFDPGETLLETCFNCGEEGHVAVNCPMEKRKRPCFVCGLFGHNSKQCTQVGLPSSKALLLGDLGMVKTVSSAKKEVILRKTALKSTIGILNSLLFVYDVENQVMICLDVPMIIHAMMLRKVIYVALTSLIFVQKKLVVIIVPNLVILGCAKQRREVSTAATPTLCYKCGEEGHFARGCTKNTKSDRMNGESSAYSRKKGKGKKDFGTRSAPHDARKTSKRKSPLFEERRNSSHFKSKARGGWIADDADDQPYKKYKPNVWASPSTPKKQYNNHQFSSGGDYSTPQSSRWQKHGFASPSATYSPNARKHSFSSSRFASNTHVRRVHRCHLRTSAVLRDRRGEGEGGRRDKAEKMV